MNIKEIKEKLQEHIAIHGVPEVKQDQEPDMKSYMDSEAYAKEFDDAFGNPVQQLDDIIASLGVNHEH